MTLVEGTLTLHPIADAAHVDQWRAALGLEPLADYVAYMQRHAIGKHAGE